jgi:SH3-like domain-containing protein
MNKSKFLLLILSVAFSFNSIAESKKIQLANRVIQSVGRKFAPDKRTAIFSVQTSELAGKIILKGKTDHPEAQKLMLDSLSILKINVQDSVLILPDKNLGDKTWGIVKLSVANIRTTPAHAAEMATQALMGTPVKILEEKGEWWLIQTPDLYIGWANHGAIIPKTADEMTAWKKNKRFIYNKLNGFAWASPDKKALPISDLVLCDLFEVVGETKGYLQAKLPDDRTAYIRKNECLSFEDWTNHPLDIPSVLSVARQMMGVPYFWGGTSSKATDCSGLTKTSYYSQGVVLARDASQQVRYGEHPDFSDYRNLASGDFIFFGSNPQRVTHVALCLGNGLFIHASGSSAMVRLNSLNPNDPLFDASLLKIVVGSSRVANSLNTEGITQVKNHPWYSVINGQF